jgi:hypothetical protein
MNMEYVAKVRDEPRLLGRLLGYDKLRTLHDQWIRECWDTKGSHALMAYRGSYKTTSVVTLGIIRYLLFFPDARILVIRKTFTDAAKIVKAISTAFDKPPVKLLFYEVHGIPPRKTIDNDGRLSFNFKSTITPEANLTAYGIGTAITGTHADVIIADDIIGFEDRASRAERESVKDHIREIAANIIDPRALTIWLGTKWAQGDGWNVIGEFSEIKKYPVEQYNFLPPEEIEEKRRRLTPFLFAVNYSLELMADESLMFQDPRWGPFDLESWRTMPVLAHLDCAYGRADTCALTIMAGNHMIGFLHEGHVQGWYKTIVEKYRKYRCRKILLETNSDKGYVAKDLRNLGLTTHTYNERDNKAIKISTYLYGAWGELIWDEGTDQDYMNQILDYRSDGTGHDDAPDSAAVLCRERDRKSGQASKETLDWLFGREV